MAITNLVKLDVYVTLPPYEAVKDYREIRDRMMSGRTAAATNVGVTDLAASGLLVEIEAVAAAATA